MIGSNQVKAQGGRLERDNEDIHIGLLLEVHDGLIAVCHAHAAVQPPEDKPAPPVMTSHGSHSPGEAGTASVTSLSSAAAAKDNDI